MQILSSTKLFLPYLEDNNIKKLSITPPLLMDGPHPPPMIWVVVPVSKEQ